MNTRRLSYSQNWKHGESFIDEQVNIPGMRMCILIPCRNGEATIADAIKSARNQADVYVINDASTDSTSSIARSLDVTVIDLDENIGKALAVRHALDIQWQKFDGKRIPELYDFVMILDDDTALNPDYVEKTIEFLDKRKSLAACEGHSVSYWKDSKRWNGFIGARAFATWRTQLVMYRLQSFFNARTWINGALTTYRARILDQVVRDNPYFVTEDADWCWQIHRQKLGEIKYNTKAVATLQEPSNWNELYKQHLRWAWGSWQIAITHKLGRKRSRADLSWLTISIDAIFYWLWPLYMVMLFSTVTQNIALALAWYFAGYGLLGIFGAIILRKWRMLIVWPTLIIYDINWRIALMHGFIKALRKPTVKKATWVSPTRVNTQRQEAA
ncbi:MAG: glycosyltransferase family 2 protein [Acidimicrobiia bacterium]